MLLSDVNSKEENSPENPTGKEDEYKLKELIK